MRDRLLLSTRLIKLSRQHAPYRQHFSSVNSKHPGARRRKPLWTPASTAATAVLLAGSGAGWLLSHPPEELADLADPAVHEDPLDVFTYKNLNASTLHYRQASASSLLCSWAVYYACGLPWLIDAAPSMLRGMDAFRRNVPFLGDACFWVMKGFLRATFFGKFVAGEDVAGCKETMDQLEALGAGGLLSYSAEAEEGQTNLQSEPLQPDIETNMEAISLAAQYPLGIPAGQATTKPTWVAIKVTGFLKDPSVLIRASEALESSSAWQRGTLGYAPEIFPPSLMLSDSDQHALDSLITELRRMLTVAKASGVRLDFDAEQSWFQTALDHMVHSLAQEFNSDSVIVYNTYQCYRKDSLERLQRAHSLCSSSKAAFGAKLVRGAYMVAERERAARLNRESPIWEDKAGTDDCFDDCAKYMLEAVQDDLKAGQSQTPTLPRAGVMIASHNPGSTRKVLEILRARGVMPSREDGKLIMSNELRERLTFGQLYAMSDGALRNLCYMPSFFLPLIFCWCPFSFNDGPELDSGVARRPTELLAARHQVLGFWVS